MILARKWKRMNQMSTPPFWGVFREVFRLRFVIPALGVTWKWALLSEPFHPLKAKNFKNMPRATFLTGKLQTTYSAKHSLRFFYFCAFWNTLMSKGLLWSYIIIASGIGDDVPILGAVVTLFGGNCLLLFLFMFLYMSMLGSSYIIIVSGMGDVVPILSAVVIVFTVVFDGRRVMRW